MQYVVAIENAFQQNLWPRLQVYAEKRDAVTGIKKKVRETYDLSDFRKAAATYSPTWWGSTIGAGGFNFSVRYGKRWDPAAITTAVYYLREIIR